MKLGSASGQPATLLLTLAVRSILGEEALRYQRRL
jgi:hypothetical protein